ncbi:hypothetical protein [Pandoraea sp. CB10b_02]|uniref:hypothetical protein n=1 Tax=Pandoraea sp. CB10b_02 TaxID=2014535 RepID=UPI0025802A73|nr:hypothetical protein [Pandoraea sp. CB10b_02]
MGAQKRRIDIRAGLLTVYVCAGVAPLCWRRLLHFGDWRDSLAVIVAGTIFLASAIITALSTLSLLRLDSTLKRVMIAIITSFVFFFGASLNLAFAVQGLASSLPPPPETQKHCHAKWRAASSWRPGI